MKYEKEYMRGDGRRLLRGGPRDMQRRQKLMEQQSYEDAALIEVLRDEINNLKSELSNRPKSKGNGEFTAEELNEEVNKAVASTISELEDKHKKEIDKLKIKLVKLETQLENKDSMIKELKDLLSSHGARTTVPAEEDDRPKMDEPFIDPLEEGAGDNLEAHLKSNDSEEEEDMNDKVSKLKNIMGKGKLLKK